MHLAQVTATVRLVAVVIGLILAPALPPGGAFAPGGGTSVLLAQACTANPVVTSTADSGANSLRQAIADACAGDTVTFNLGSGAHTINLTSGLFIGKNLTVNGPGANLLTVRRAGGGEFSVFHIGPSTTVTLAGMRIADGYNVNGGPPTPYGGGIANQDAFLTVIACDIVNNHSVYGGGIGTTFGTSLNRSITVIDSTISGNVAEGSGGGIYSGPGNGPGTGPNLGGQLTVRNSTISGNESREDGGGLAFGGNISSGNFAIVVNSTIAYNRTPWNHAGISKNPSGLLTVSNTILWGNLYTGFVPPEQGTSPLPDDDPGDLEPGSTNNIIGIDARLGPLADNGGPTPTHALLIDSPALDAGDDAAATAAGLTHDQRGFARISDGPDVDTTATVDVGAFEARQVAVVLDDQTGLEDAGPYLFPFHAGDLVTGASAMSSNPALVTGAGLQIIGTGSNRTISVTPQPNQFGTTTITVTIESGSDTTSETFDLTVGPVADTPSITNAATIEDEQTGPDLVISRNAADGAEVGFVKISSITGGRLYQTDGATEISDGMFITIAEGGAGLRFTPLLHSIATGHFSAQASLAASDAGLGGAIVTANITVTPEADTPTVSNAATSEDTQTSGGLVITRHVADGSEVTYFKITGIIDGTLYRHDGVTSIANGSYITDIQGADGLRFTPSPNFFGTGHFTVQASLDNTDAGLGGSPVTADITVVPVADAPGVTAAATDEDTQTSSGLVLTVNPADGVEVTHFRVSTIANGALFKHDGVTLIAVNGVITVAEGTAGLRFTPSADFFGAASVGVQGATSPAGAGAGAATSATITVAPVPDTPSITNAATVVNQQTASGLVVTRNAVDGGEVTHAKVISVTGGTLFQHDGTTAIAAGAFITMTQVAAGLRFTPQPDSVVTGHVTVQASVNNTDAGLGGGAVTADISVGRIPSATVLTGSGTTTKPGQAVTFTATVTPATAGPGGTVQFKDGATNLGAPVPLSSGAAIFTTTSLAPGPHTITAEYSGNALCLPSAATLAGGHLVMTPTTTMLTSGMNPSLVDAPVTLTATVAASSGSGTPTGSVTFKQASSTLATVALVNGIATFKTPGLTIGDYPFAAEYAGDAAYLESADTLDQVVASGRVITTGADAPLGPLVRRVSAGDGLPIDGPTASFAAFAAASTSGVRVAEADLTGDGVPDILAGTGPGMPSFVRAFDGVTGAEYAGGPIPGPAAGGVFVAAGDVDGDGRADAIVSAGSGAPLVQVFNGATRSFLFSLAPPAPGFTGGVRVASGDIDGDGLADIILGAGPGGQAIVAAFSAATRTEMGQVNAYPGSAAGVFVAAGDVNGDGHADVITGPGAGAGAEVHVYDGRDGSLRLSIAAGAGFEGGVRVAAGDVDGDGRADVIAATGEGGNQIRMFNGLTGAPIDQPILVGGETNGLFVSTAIAENRLVIGEPQDGTIQPGAFRISGFAFQEGAPGIGVDAVSVWGRALGGGPLVFVGAATMGDERPDVAERFGHRYAASGYHLDVSDVPPGDYEIVVLARNSATGVFNARRATRVRVAAPPGP